MMRGLVVFIIGFLSTIGIAQEYSNFIVRSADSIPFILELDGIKQLDSVCYDVKVERINDQAHQVRVLLPQEDSLSIEKALYFQNMGVESTMELVNQDGEYKLKYFGEVSMGAAPIIEGQLVVQYNNGKSSKRIAQPNFDEMSKVELYSYELQNNSVIASTNTTEIVSVETDHEELPKPVVSDSLIRDSLSSLLDSNKTYNPEVLNTVYNYAGKKGCSFPNIEVDDLVAAINEASFSSQKIKVAKNGVRNKCLTTEQVGRIARTLEFEDDKLDFIKFAYNYTYDRENYKSLLKLFNFSNTRTDFLEFINV